MCVFGGGGELAKGERRKRSGGRGGGVGGGRLVFNTSITAKIYGTSDSALHNVAALTITKSSVFQSNQASV